MFAGGPTNYSYATVLHEFNTVAYAQTDPPGAAPVLREV